MQVELPTRPSKHQMARLDTCAEMLQYSTTQLGQIVIVSFFG